jgi:hypothetical protein
MFWRDAGTKVEPVSAHPGPKGVSHGLLSQFSPEFRSARATFDRSMLLLSRRDTRREPLTLVPPSRPISAPQAALLARIEEEVISLRGLEKKSDLAPQFLDRSNLRAYLLAVASDPSVANLQEEYLKLTHILGLGTGDFMSIEAMVEVLSDQILGFYSPEGKYLMLVNSSSSLSGGEKATYAHEFTHALQDQHFGLTEMSDVASVDGDQAAAMRALVEGDAAYAEIRWAMQSLSPSEISELVFGDAALSSRGQPSMDELVAKAGSAAFTYGQGMRFVHHLHNLGGFSAVNAAMKRPPTTTEQIFHPEKYLSGEGAQPVDLPDAALLLGSGWSSLISDSLGMLGIDGLISEYADGRAASRVAEGWGGDKFSLMEHEDGRRVFVLRTVWDSERDAIEFHNAMSESQRNRFRITQPALQRFSSWQLLGSSELTALVARDAREVLVTIATDERVAREVASRLGFSRNSLT